ncbi:recombinase family protein, partial [Azospirillum sp. TSA6c]|uniref:recombinase family protein n=2 Tax=unclassified Azospirillum TaxID=2630922 RepID=UPI0024950EC9
MRTFQVPGGRRWVDTTIRGQVARGTGILNNANYAGVLEWGRCEFVKEPGTGKRVARINPQAKREIVEVPELRIIDDVLWNRVKVRQEAVATEIGRDEQGNALNRDQERALVGIDRKIASILEAVENGMYSPSLKERLSALEAERATL